MNNSSNFILFLLELLFFLVILGASMTIKKAELHVHLEGTISPSIAHKLAKRNGLPVPGDLVSPDGKSFLSRDFMHFLSVFDTVAAFIKTPQDYYDLTFDYLKSCAMDHAIYVELAYSPDHAEKVSGIPSIEHLYAIEQAINDAQTQYGIISRIIIIAVRHFGVEACVRTAENIYKQSIPYVTGFGLGGDEINFPPELFYKAYHIAADAGLACTVHAGEFAPANKVMDAIEILPIRRIGHGVQIIHSPDTMALIKERDIALELCPTSNIKFGLFKDMQNHPLPQLMEYGIKISINTDDPPFVNTSIGREYEYVQRAYQYTDDTMRSITATAIDCAFVDNKTKETLLAKLWE